jgi:GalNAc5-diNAcBac-PP-undecaprenol beta-1,3-glucosyltransferase
MTSPTVGSQERLTFSVVIPTNNRSALVIRAIESVYATKWPGIEVIVVDDASEDDTVAIIKERYPGVHLIRMPTNRGPGAARNAGISAATSQWALMLDDDDLLLPEALEIVRNILNETPKLEQYPVIQFAHTNANTTASFLIADLQNYVLGNISGDFAPVIQTEVFRHAGFRYPERRIGGEHLLWYQIAQTFGIPTFSIGIIRLTRDAPTKLCSVQTQLARPREYAELLEETVGSFGTALSNINPAFYRKKVIGGIVYRILAGDRGIARATVLRSSSLRKIERLALASLTCLPTPIVRKAFQAYRSANA